MAEELSALGPPAHQNLSPSDALVASKKTMLALSLTLRRLVFSALDEETGLWYCAENGKRCRLQAYSAEDRRSPQLRSGGNDRNCTRGKEGHFRLDRREDRQSKQSLGELAGYAGHGPSSKARRSHEPY
jgi:hypothetical protein